ncbi:MAG: ECF transporter S component [Saccharofermentanales bacterium]|jgi:uncharacterized membrane protein|nr:hypothetical protein [Clostridiaceae bacterium]
MKEPILKITYGGILSAVVLLATYAITVPIPNSMGYFNLGDGVIFGISAIIGPFSGLCAALGSALADLAYQAPIYIPGTMIIKGGMGLLAGTVLTRMPELRWYWQAVLFVICELIMVGGYFLYELLIFGHGYAIGTVTTNLLQGAAGIVLGLAIVPLARRVKNVLHF